MEFRKHSNLEGAHAFMGASKFHWINYDEEKLAQVYMNMQATKKGTKYHEFAAMAIELRERLPKSKKTLNSYVNDAIGFRMIPEVVLYYSPNCFGTADAICFRNDMLRIHDLKTGTTPAHIEQLFIYEALFCLEYDIRPSDIQTELRLYQNNEILVCNPSTDDIVPIMSKIKRFDQIIEQLKSEERYE